MMEYFENWSNFTELGNFQDYQDKAGLLFGIFVVVACTLGCFVKFLCTKSTKESPKSEEQQSLLQSKKRTPTSHIRIDNYDVITLKSSSTTRSKRLRPIPSTENGYSYGLRPRREQKYYTP